ncbi:hypothetical protein [Azospirillum rugosum]|uniref:Exonuclease VII small subunit n=1 Tax=Azospirillum rugosum TaxID=416170 RepID=A0ABS4SXM6_9PROT|nr:hypothetical protein [Azospirillum rugosum]MBP2297314.1 exonuclease VII small subunit [Azospirillum rugosum]MDQ0531156.1 exonuclease VII small subunit [Azospirillum rugosum]
MPLPLLVPVALGLAGLFGVGKAAQAAYRNSEANGIQETAADIVSTAEKSLESGKDTCNTALRTYGEMKIDILSNEIKDFVDLYGRLKNVQLGHSHELDRLQIGDFTEVILEDLRHSCSFAAQFVGGVAAGAGAGALTAFGAYSGTMALASAGTGAAISGLSGVAATNATLAWLGGGTLAAGGYGIAGGTMVLGTLVAGPALLVLGSVLSARASKKLDDARANLEKAQTYDTEVNVVLEKLKAIVEVTIVGQDLVRSLKERLHAVNDALERVIETRGVDYTAYGEDEKNTVFRSVKVAQLVKKVIDTPILNEDGSLAKHTLIGFQGIKETM